METAAVLASKEIKEDSETPRSSDDLFLLWLHDDHARHARVLLEVVAVDPGLLEGVMEALATREAWALERSIVANDLEAAGDVLEAGEVDDLADRDGDFRGVEALSRHLDARAVSEGEARDEEEERRQRGETDGPVHGNSSR
jgi:hypothetical protein